MVDGCATDNPLPNSPNFSNCCLLWFPFSSFPRSRWGRLAFDAGRDRDRDRDPPRDRERERERERDPRGKARSPRDSQERGGVTARPLPWTRFKGLKSSVPVFEILTFNAPLDVPSRRGWGG